MLIRVITGIVIFWLIYFVQSSDLVYDNLNPVDIRGIGTASALSLPSISTPSISVSSISTPSISTSIGSVSSTLTNLSTTTTTQQQSLLSYAVFPPLTSGSAIIKTLGISTYVLPNSSIAVIPTIVTTVNAISGQVIATTPLAKIIPGQELIILIDDSLIPSFGGLKGLDIQSSPTANSTGITREWLVAEVDNKVPTTISWGIASKNPFLYVNIQYSFEQSGVGFNWGNPNNHAKPPVMILVVNKASPTPVQMDSAGCPIVDAYTLVSGSWINTGLGEISSRSINPTQCQIAIQSQHLSKFAFSLRHIDSIQNFGGPGQFGVGKVMFDTSSTSLGKSTKSMSLALAVTSLINFVNPSFTANAQLFEGFSSIQCRQVPGYVLMTGNYTGGAIPHNLILLKMSVLDARGHVLASGGNYILNVGAHKTKLFNAMTRFHGQYSSCTIQIQSAQ